jgi:hypothetical protein
VGHPPFYTNNIFQLVNLITKDPVKCTCAFEQCNFLTAVVTNAAADKSRPLLPLPLLPLL